MGVMVPYDREEDITWQPFSEDEGDKFVEMKNFTLANANILNRIKIAFKAKTSSRNKKGQVKLEFIRNGEVVSEKIVIRRIKNGNNRVTINSRDLKDFQYNDRLRFSVKAGTASVVVDNGSIDCSATEGSPPPNVGFYTLGHNKTKVSWPEAQQACVEWGGHLVSIRNAEEQQQIVDFIKTQEPVWTGGNDLLKEGSFEWQVEQLIVIGRPS